ncbi:MAG: hypothetical protein GY745_12705 [Actinomycetia bacterium]|nr:hypothetical protein [Actinomycetes bacterium]MCP4085897.1 hypothetical protein [Actinomycetes bacterium]
MSRLAVYIVIATVAAWVVCAVALWIHAGPGRPSERREVVIEQGDAEPIAQGENPLELTPKARS